MKPLQYAVSEPHPAPVIVLATLPAESTPGIASRVKPLIEILGYSPGPVLCRCGRSFSEDFEGRLFCRGCEGSDPADITARLPFCYAAH
jgi:hypothetical protein